MSAFVEFLAVYRRRMSRMCHGFDARLIRIKQISAIPA